MEKSEIKERKERAKVEKVAIAEAKKDAEALASKEHLGVSTDVCPCCSQQFLSMGWFNHHRNR